MALTLATIARNAGADAITALADAGAGAGDIQIATTAFASILATITLSDPAYGAAASGVATLQGTPLSDSSADNTGTAAVYRVRDSDTNVVFDGPVATSGGGDINLSTNARNAAVDAIAALCNGGDVQFTTAGDTSFASPILTLSLSSPAFAAASSGSADVDVTPALTANASGSGTATLFRFRTSGAAEVFRGTVGTSGEDINFDNNVWVSGQPITLNSFALSIAATSAASDGALVINNTSIVAGQNVEITSGDFDQPAS
jgi:hypothetical protein